MKHLKWIIPLALLLLFGGCTGNYAVNPLYGICLMANDSLYVCTSAVADGELPDGLESIGKIEDFGSALPKNNFEATSNDFGSELFAIPGETDKLYSYNADKEQHWLFSRCDTGVVLDGWLYIAQNEHTHTTLPEGYTSAGTVSACVESGVPTAELEAMGIDVGTEIFSNSKTEQLYARLDNPGDAYLGLKRFTIVELE